MANVKSEIEIPELEKDLQYQKIFNKTLLEAIPISVLLLDPRLTVIFANKNFFQKTKKGRDDVLSKNISVVFPEPFLSGSNLGDRITETINSQTSTSGEIRFRRFTYRYQTIPIEGMTGSEVNVLLLLEDITRERLLSQEILQVERHLANVVESANDLVFSCDRNGRILTWNRAANETLGYSTEEVEGKKFSSLCSKKDASLVDEEFSNLRRKLKESSSLELIFTTKDEDEVRISWSFGVTHDYEGNPVGLMGVGRDLTEQRRMEAQMVQSAKMASLGTMAGGMAHELRNPLAIIAGTSQLLSQRVDETFVKDCTKRITTSTSRAAEIIENLLRFSQVSGSELESVDMHEALNETLDLVTHQITLEGIEVSREFIDDLPLVQVNKNRLQQVFMNMLMNASDAMKDKGGHLTIETAMEDRTVRINFTDTGRGIPGEDITRIFDPFFTTKGSDKNTGLGLFVSYGIVKSFGGDITVTSKKGEGTTFTISLPVE